MGKLKEFVENCVENYRSAGESSTKGQTEVILEKFAEHMDNEGVGSADWNTLQNKPFGETREFDDIVWDGVTTGRDNFSASGFNFYKVSSDITDANMLDGHKLVDSSGFEVIFDSANFVSGTGITSVGGYQIVVVSALEFDMPDIGAGTAPSTGLYTFTTKTFTISGTSVKKLDNQFIKTPVMIVTFSENLDKVYYTASVSLSEVHEAMAKNCLVVGYFPDRRTYLPNVYSPDSGSCAFSAVYTSNLDRNAAEYIEFTLGPNQTEVTKTVKQIAFTN